MVLDNEPQLKGLFTRGTRGNSKHGSSLDAQFSAQPILRGEVPTIKSTLMYVVGKAEARIGYRAIPDSRS